jgi:formylglycine-generating enzyme required for sulfatase activity/chitodextrinase
VRKARRWMGAAAVLAAAAFWGCGEQDLYRPPTSPYKVVGRVPLPSIAEDVDILGHYAYVAGGEAGLHVVDISNPHAPVLVTTINTTKYAEAVKVAGTPTAQGVVDIAFVVEGTEGITTYNITDPDSTYSFNQGTTAVDGNGLFVDIPETPTDRYSVFLAESWKGIRIFESDPQFPGVLRYNGVFAGTRGYAKAIAVADGFAYVADDELGLTVLDVRTRILGAVRVVANTDTDGNAKGIAVANGYAYIADGKDGVVIMAIHGGDAPVLKGRLALPGDCRAIEVHGRYAFLSASDAGIHIVDISNPALPVLAGTVVTTYATGLAVSDAGVVCVSDRTDGLVILAGPGSFPDGTPPAAIGDLAASSVNATTVRLRWHAPGDDAFEGLAQEYAVRYDTTAITEARWDSCAAAANPPIPAASGAAESFDVTGLAPDTGYFFAVKTEDDAGNWSQLSNVASAITYAGNVPPSLSSAGVSPAGAAPGSEFTFTVTYTDPDGDLPSRADLVLNGESRAMTAGSGSAENGIVYNYVTALERGSYEHSFAFDDGNDHPVETATTAGPWVGDVFTMGSPPDEPGRDTDEDQHIVVLAWDVSIADHEVTQAEYEAVMGAAANDSYFRGPNRPVERVSWFDAVEYCNARSIQEGLTPAYAIDGRTVTWNTDADGYRLPTEAEWERACRAGSTTAFTNGPITVLACVDSSGSHPDPVLDQTGWYCGNAGVSTHDVKGKVPNAQGLYDMHGNVWEWCWNWYAASPPVGDPVGPASGVFRVIRGGSWYYNARDCRSASRAPYPPDSKDNTVGFRVARTVFPR